MQPHKATSVEQQISIAMELAKLYHQDQRYGIYPYFRHLEEVHHTLQRTFFADTYSHSIAQAVTWLHDVLEDTNINIKILEHCLEPITCMAIQLLTLPPAPTRNIQFAMMYAAIEAARISKNKDVQQAARIATVVKNCDRYCNVKASMDDNPDKLERYIYEWPNFQNCFWQPARPAALMLGDLMFKISNP